MSKAIGSFKGAERMEVIRRRINGNAGGLGTISAKEALKKEGETKKEVKETKES